MPTVTQDPTVASWTPINMWAMLRALINNSCPLLTINGTLYPVTNSTFAGQAGKGTLLIDYANGILYMNAGTLASPNWSTVLSGPTTGSFVGEETFVPTSLSVNGVISPNVSATYVITKVGAGLFTLAAPIAGPVSAGGNDGVSITISSRTPYNHIVSANGLIQSGTAYTNYITFPSFAGGEVDLMAFNGKWIVMNLQSVSIQ